jgi:hypothetical protein
MWGEAVMEDFRADDFPPACEAGFHDWLNALISRIPNLPGIQDVGLLYITPSPSCRKNEGIPNMSGQAPPAAVAQAQEGGMSVRFSPFPENHMLIPIAHGQVRAPRNRRLRRNAILHGPIHGKERCNSK